MSNSEERLLTVDEASALLHVPKSWLYSQSRLGTKGAVPVIRIGRYVRYERGQLRAWIAAHRQGDGPNGG